MKIVVDYPDEMAAKALEEALEGAVAAAAGSQRPEYNAGFLAGVQSVVASFEGAIEAQRAEHLAKLEKHGRQAS